MKGVSYKARWIEYCDVEAFCIKHSVPPTSTQAPMYTIPLIEDPSSASVVESFAIAKYLDATYPGDVTLVPEGTDAFQTMFVAMLPSLLTQHLLPVHAARIATSLSPRSEDYFRRPREAQFGMPFAEIARESKHESM